MLIKRKKNVCNFVTSERFKDSTSLLTNETKVNKQIAHSEFVLKIIIGKTIMRDI